MMDLREADALASSAHRGQKDKIGAPYIDHVRAVSEGVAPFGLEVRIGGLLHDVVEDTELTLNGLLKAGVPGRSVRIVDAVTKRPGMTREQQIEQVLNAGRDAILVKISDNAHNTLPNRVAQLPVATQKRLRLKYAAARSALWRSVEPDEVKAILEIVNPSLLNELRRELRGPRPDIEAYEVASLWIEGKSVDLIAAHFKCNPATIRRRLKDAREAFPELPWSEREELPPESIKGFVQMNDGKKGEGVLREGSIIRGASLRRR